MIINQTMPIMGTLCLSFVFTWILIKLAHRYNWLDRDPHGIKLGKEPIPSFGGLAIYASFWIGLLWVIPLSVFTSEQWAMLIASTLVLFVGLIDDKWELRPWQKAIGILIGAHIIYFLGDIQFSTRLLPHLPANWFDFLGYGLTIGWIFMVTNAINLLDGLDGLASSVSATSLLTLAVTTYYFSLSVRYSFLMMFLLLTAAIIGFLPFNRYPAQIYLGDTGALFIGFMYATLTVSNLKNATFFSLILPVVLYAVPLFDAVYAAIRRILQGQSPVQADQEHLHHRLLRFGLSEKDVVALMFGITLFFSLLALLIQVFMEWRIVFLVLVGIGLVFLVYMMNKLADKTK